MDLVCDLVAYLPRGVDVLDGAGYDLRTGIHVRSLVAEDVGDVPWRDGAVGPLALQRPHPRALGYRDARAADVLGVRPERKRQALVEVRDGRALREGERKRERPRILKDEALRSLGVVERCGHDGIM